MHIREMVIGRAKKIGNRHAISDLLVLRSSRTDSVKRFFLVFFFFSYILIRGKTTTTTDAVVVVGCNCNGGRGGGVAEVVLIRGQVRYKISFDDHVLVVCWCLVPACLPLLSLRSVYQKQQVHQSTLCPSLQLC